MDGEYPHVSKDRADLSNIADKLDLIDQIDTHAFFLSTHATFTNIDYLLSQKRNLKNFRRRI